MFTNKKLKIYIAGPYTPVNTDQHDAPRIVHKNVIKAIRAGIKVIKKGHIPFIPHLTHFIHLETEEPLSKEFYYEYDLEWLKLCDAFLYLDSSEGADKELQIAETLGLKIFNSIDEIPEYHK